MQEIIEIEDFIKKAECQPVIDARSEVEFQQGHFPGAINIPLLNNQERAIVGTVYKKEGKEKAVLKGFDLVGGKFGNYIRQAKKIGEIKYKGIGYKGKEESSPIPLYPMPFLVYCWRGGMRSGIMSWLLSTAGFNVSLLKGGYKTYRNWSLEMLKKDFPIIVLGGKTGSAKTELLHAIKAIGEQVIDLEALAAHKGSSFGALGQNPQPTNEYFENLLAMEFSKLDINRPVWLENESRTIGKVILPKEIFEQMRKTNIIELSMSDSERINHIKENYAGYPFEALAECTSRLEKKLGNKRMNEALTFLFEKDYENWIKILLEYYDKTYSFATSTRNPKTVLPASIKSIKNYTANAEQLISFAAKMKGGIKV